MNIPRYKVNQLDIDTTKGEFYNKDLHEFFKEFLERELYDNDTQEGILKRTVSEGTYDLSEKQIYHLQQIIKPFENLQCSICGVQPEINELIDFEENSKLCSYHLHQTQKDD